MFTLHNGEQTFTSYI